MNNSKKELKIGFLGAGKMATAIIKGLLSSNTFDKDHVLASEVNEVYLERIRQSFGIKATSDITDILDSVDIVLIATKPFVVCELMERLKDRIKPKHLIVSIAAGVTFEKLENILGKDQRIVRVMPNTPALLGCGMSAVCKNNAASDEDFDTVLNIFEQIGKVIKCEEKEIDAITGISGSGPAFYYYIIDQIAKAGEKLGLDYQTALTLSAQTALGAAKMIQETDNTPEELITAVTTPGGTTAEGNKVLNESTISDILFETVKKTAEKSAQMSK